MALNIGEILSSVISGINAVVASNKPAPASGLDANTTAAVNALLQQQANKAAVESGFFGLSINALILITVAIVGVFLIARQN